MKKLLLTSFAITLLAGCTSSNVKETLGLKKNAPDEFMVLSHPALTVPPNFTLPEPGQELHEFDSKSVLEGAKSELIAGKPSKDSGTFSKGESSLLKKANADKSDPKIREKLRTEREIAIQEKTDKEDTVVGTVEGAIDSIRGKGDPVIDADAEQKRIKENAKEGKPVNEGVVKEIDPKKKPLIDLNNYLQN